MDPSMESASSDILGVFGILKEGFKITWKNKKFMILTTLLLLPPFIILSLGNCYILAFLMQDIKSKVTLDENNRSGSAQTLVQVQKGVRVLVGLEIVFMIGLWLVKLAVLMVIIHSSAMIYVGQHLTIKKMLSTIRKTFKRPAITWLYVSLFTIAYHLFTSILIWVVLPEGGAFIVVAALIALAAIAFYLYLSAVWVTGLVISIVEEDCYGLAALTRSGELIKGRRVQAFVLMLLLTILALTIFVASSFMILMAPFTFALLVGSLLFLVNLLLLAAYTVFYYDCKKSHGEKIEMHGLTPRETYLGV